MEKQGHDTYSYGGAWRCEVMLWRSGVLLSHEMEKRRKAKNCDGMALRRYERILI